MNDEVSNWNHWYDTEDHKDQTPVPDDAVFVSGDRDPDEGGYGHHSGDAVFRLTDGTFIAVSCGGCSCDSGSWYISDPQPTEAEAKKYLGKY